MPIHSTSMRATISLLALASACTLRPATLEGGDELGDETESDSESESDTDSGTETTDSTETGEESAACITDQGQLASAGLLLDEDNDSARLFVDGTEQMLALAGPDHPQVFFLAATKGDHVAIARASGWWGDDIETTVQSFSISSGELEWSRQIPNAWINNVLWVSEAGEVSGSGIGPQQDIDGFAIVGGPVLEFVERRPLAAPRDGRVAASTFDGIYGWIEIATDTFSSHDPQPADGKFHQVVDDRTLEYLAEGDLGLEFVRADFGDTQSIPLPSVPGILYPSYSAGDFRLLVAYDADTDSQAYIRVDVESGEALLLEPELPIGHEWFEGCFDRARALDPDGTVVFVLHDGGSAQTFAWQPETAQWTAIGLPITATSHVGLFAPAGSVHVEQSVAAMCEQLEWSDPPIGALLGDSMQLIRHQPALALELPQTVLSVSIDDEEHCAAYRNGDAWWVRALEGEAELEIGAGSRWLWLE